MVTQALTESGQGVLVVVSIRWRTKRDDGTAEEASADGSDIEVGGGGRRCADCAT